MQNKHNRKRLERTLWWTSLLAVGPSLGICIFFIMQSDWSGLSKFTAIVVLVTLLLGSLLGLRHRIIRPLQTVSSMLSAMRQGDFSAKIYGYHPQDVMGEIFFEMNEFGNVLRQQRLGAAEATALLKTIMAEIEVALFAFDAKSKLTLLNPAGERLLGRPAPQLLGHTARELDLDDILEGESEQTITRIVAGRNGRWDVRRGHFREGGKPHTLVLMSDVSQPLREEERQAWKRIIRVIGHELNNSLAPMISISSSLISIVKRDPMPPDWEEDLEEGLDIIKARSEGLSRFMEAYSRMAKLPPPSLTAVDIKELIRRVVKLEDSDRVHLKEGDSIMLQADADQLEQAIINLLHNAIYAAEETNGQVMVSWRKEEDRWLDILIEDEGPGISNPSNLFVPFFTTKSTGSGIGLVLSRNIAEAHNGSLDLNNRQGQTGCVATLRFPL